MNGPDILGQAERHERVVTAMEMAPELSRQEIGRYIAHGRDLRAEHLAQWGRNVARTWRSLFYHGYLLPADTRRAAG